MHDIRLPVEQEPAQREQYLQSVQAILGEYVYIDATRAQARSEFAIVEQRGRHADIADRQVLSGCCTRGCDTRSQFL